MSITFNGKPITELDEVENTRLAAAFVHRSAPRAQAVRHADSLGLTGSEWLEAYRQFLANCWKELR